MQSPEEYRPKIYLRCLAQAIDPDDFVHVWGMAKWMSLYEQMCNEIPNVNILATNEEMVAHMRIANWTAPIYNISGLSFGKEEVQGRVTDRKPFAERKMRVIFGARWDQEKQPAFFMDMIRHWKSNPKLPEVEFAICCGGPLRSNNQVYVDQARLMEKEGTLKIYENLKKDEYYNILARFKGTIQLCITGLGIKHSIRSRLTWVPMYCFRHTGHSQKHLQMTRQECMFHGQAETQWRN